MRPRKLTPMVSLLAQFDAVVCEFGTDPAPGFRRVFLRYFLSPSTSHPR